MTEKCLGFEPTPLPLTMGRLYEIFPDLKQVYTGAELNDGRRKNGVYVLDKGFARFVLIKGTCPNLKNGSCSLSGNCMLKRADDTKFGT